MTRRYAPPERIFTILVKLSSTFAGVARAATFALSVLLVLLSSARNYKRTFERVISHKGGGE